MRKDEFLWQFQWCFCFILLAAFADVLQLLLSLTFLDSSLRLAFLLITITASTSVLYSSSLFLVTCWNTDQTCRTLDSIIIHSPGLKQFMFHPSSIPSTAATPGPQLHAPQRWGREIPSSWRPRIDVGSGGLALWSNSVHRLDLLDLLILFISCF